LAVIALVLVFALAGAVFLPRVLRNRSLHQAEDRWLAAGLTDYTWRIDTGCFGGCTNGTPVTLVVHAGQAVRALGHPLSSMTSGVSP